MYQVDERDKVLPLPGVPSSDVGAPMPAVIADEDTVFLAYYVSSSDPDAESSPVAIIRFHSPRAQYFGAPNDESLDGHPLWSRGLRSYGGFVVEQSSWIRSLEQMNRVPSQHHPALFEGYRHYILTFHDSTFECVARGIAVERPPAGAGEPRRVVLSELG